MVRKICKKGYSKAQVNVAYAYIMGEGTKKMSIKPSIGIKKRQIRVMFEQSIA